MYIIFDTETTGLPRDYNAPITDHENWPRMVQLAWQVHDKEGKLVEVENYIVKPEGYTIPYETAKIHGITTERALAEGHELTEVLEIFNQRILEYEVVAGHNIEFDVNIVGAELDRMGMDTSIMKAKQLDTKNLATDFCAIPSPKGRGFKWPNLTELHFKLFGEGFDEAHNAAADVEATARCFLELIRLEVIPKAELGMTQEELDTFKAANPNPIKAIGLAIQDDRATAASMTAEMETEVVADAGAVEDIPFTHLHLHTQYSILDGLTKIPDLVKKAQDDGMQAVAITDHGNMYGIKPFHQSMSKAGIKPVLGCEFYVAYRSHTDKENKDKSSYHLVVLAKNEVGYKNLLKLSSIAFADGFYYKPRIDKDLLREYSEGLIALSACLGGEVPNKIMRVSLEAAEAALLEYKEIFGEDYYIEIQRHPADDPNFNSEVFEDQKYVNQQLIQLARKHEVKIVATNDVHVLNKEDAQAHDRLICLNTGKDIDDPNRMRYTGQEWFKTQSEMRKLWADMPEALATTQEIVDKIEAFELDKDPIMPVFEIPESFADDDDYLRHITYEGAERRWGKLDELEEERKEEITQRLDFELETIKRMGFPSYFLIVWDFLKAARDMGVIVGPGRGSAAGSAVAYCLRITDIDPLRYDLLFERFLNPDRISMPDIDIDFDDEGRDNILQWVKDKYGAKRVAHIITFGSMAAKSSIRDVARVQKLPLADADRLAKLVPDTPGVSLQKAFSEVPELNDELKNGTSEIRSVLEYAGKMEGSVRNTGTHACGIIIGRDDLDKYVPISTVKDSILDISTQYDGKYVEDIGLLKMDFLGLKTLTIIKECLENIKLSKDIDIDMDHIPLDDEATYGVYSRGETNGLFQFESPGMKKHLRALKPSTFEDLIAMVALYRPGPMEYIPSFINRKHGTEKIEYDLPEMEEYLQETYGVTVYQEQVMLLSRKLAGFTRGESDKLRKAMGKKIKAMMDELKIKFMEGTMEKGHDEKVAEKIWGDWEEFAKYAFNKSHATCYADVSYRTGYLKAHYPAEFMASVLSHNLNDIKKLNFYLDECNQMGIKVLGPDINESYNNFTVNEEGHLRYGMAGIKGVGNSAVEEIIRERKENGRYTSIFDLVQRVNLRAVNKKALEALAQCGAFDELKSAHRAQFFFQAPGEEKNFLEKIIQFGNRSQENANSAQVSLFGEAEEQVILEPDFPQCEEWPRIKQLKLEKELMGLFISGHPLDEFEVEYRYLLKMTIHDVITALADRKSGNVKFAGMITEAQHRRTKNDKPFGRLTIEDKSDNMDIMLFGENYLKFRHLVNEGAFVVIHGKLDKSFRDPEAKELRLTDVYLLEDLMEKEAKGIKVLVQEEQVTEDFIREFKNFCLLNEGSGKLSVHVQYEGEKQMTFKSGLKINPKRFMSQLSHFPDISIKLV